MTVKVKICGITNIEDARASVNSGCDALGFVFYRKSPRYITPQKASQIIKILPHRVLTIGVFVNADEERIRHIARLCHLDMLQFHGGESPDFCLRFKGYKIIKAFRIKGRFPLKNILKYNTFAYLFDAFRKDRPGGTGKIFNWKFLEGVDKLKQPVFLSGGLNAANVKAAISVVRPDWVDVSSSLEKNAGKKDYLKIYQFMKAVKGKHVTR